MSPSKEESRAYFRALGATISLRRKELDMTQAELARALGVSQQTVFACELGDRRVSLVMLLKLAKIFGIVVEKLIGLDTAPSPRRRLSPAAMRHAERYAKLSRTQQRFVARIIDVLLAQRTPTAPNWDEIVSDRPFVPPLFLSERQCAENQRVAHVRYLITPFSRSRTSARTHSPPASVFDP